MALSGGLAGLAGAVEVMGVHHRYVQGIAGNYGFDGIAVALLGGLGGFGVVLSALFFGALASGAAFMQSQTDVPDSDRDYRAGGGDSLCGHARSARVAVSQGRAARCTDSRTSTKQKRKAENAAPPAAEQVAENAPL